MKNIYLADFYQGWLIEVVQVEEGFKSNCYSPCWEKFMSQTICASEFEAMNLARNRIRYCEACYAVIGLLREFYENDRLVFDEWNVLQRSVNKLAKTAQ
jgi:hypothetical protein